jgi:hypothetical protein
VLVAVGVDVGVAVGVAVGTAVMVGVLVGARVPVAVAVGVGAGSCELPTRNQSKSAGMTAVTTAALVPPQAKSPTKGDVYEAR